MSRHIIKVSSQAELEAAIAAGIITPPYIAFDSSSNTTNLVLPSGREPASIDYEQETPVDPTPVEPIHTLGYRLTKDTNGAAYFDTEYVPQKDTVIKFKGLLKISNDGVGHGIFTSAQYVEQFGMFAYNRISPGPVVFYDRKSYGTDIRGVVSDIDSVIHEFEFGNFYVKVDGTTVASGNIINSYSTTRSLYIFGANSTPEAGTIKFGPQGMQIDYFKIYEPVNGELVLQKDFEGAIDASGNACLYEAVSHTLVYPLGTDNSSITATLIAPDSSTDSSTDSSVISDASILSFSEHQSAPGNYYPNIGTYNIDPSMNYIKVVWPTRDEVDDPSQAGYGSLTDLLDNYAYTYYELTSGQTTETISASDITVDESYVLSFYAQFVHGEEVTDEWDTTSLVVDSSKEWIQIGYIALNPYVDCVPFTEGEYDYVQDNGDGTFDLQPYPNRDAVDAGYSYFRVGLAQAEDDLTDPTTCANRLSAAPDTVYTGTENNPAQVTLDVASLWGEGSGPIIAQVCDASGNFYTTDWVCDLGAWSWYPPAAYTCPNCGAGLDYEPDSENPCSNCNYPFNE